MILFPNPASNTLNISYNILKIGDVQICLYNILGNETMKLINGYKLKGRYLMKADISNIPGGVYACKMMLKGENSIIRMLILSK